MPLESATNIAQLDANNPADDETAEKGDDHLRLIKGAILGTFPAFDGDEPVGLSEAQINQLVPGIQAAASALSAAMLPHLEPKGSIKPWDTSYAPIPAGWQAMDGSNSTKDMRDRAVIGAGSTYTEGSTYGSATATTSSNGGHDHGGSTAGHTLTTAEMPAHGHGLAGKEVYHKGGTEYDILANDGKQSTGTTLNSEGGNNPHSHGIGSVAGHTHNVSTLQPSRALTWIIKTTETTQAELDTAVTDALTALSLI